MRSHLATAKTATRIGEREAQVVAARSAERAGDLTSLAKDLRSGEAIARAGSQTILGGSTVGATVANAQRWAKATGRRTIGVPTDYTSDGASPEVVARFFGFMKTEQARLKPGERLTILMAHSHGGRHDFARLARENGIDFVWVGSPGSTTLGDAVIQADGIVDEQDLIRRVAERLWAANSSRVGPL